MTGRRDFARVQRPGRYDEAADGDDTPTEVAEVRCGVGACRQQHLIGGDAATRRYQAMARSFPRLRTDRCVLEDDRTAAFGRLGQADAVASHVHHGALLREHRAKEGRADLRAQFGGGQQRGLRIHFAMDRFKIPRDGIEVFRLGGELQLARSAEIALDALLRDQRLERVD